MEPRQVTLSVDGIALVGELHQASRKDAPVVVLCHGLPAPFRESAGRTGNALDPADPGYPGLARHLSSEGFSAFIFNFRGCGQSGGNLDMAGWRRDLTAALDSVAGTQGASGAYVVGFSAGAAVSVPVAAGDLRVRGLALMACPASFDNLRREENARGLLEQCRRVGTIRDPDFPASISEWAAGFVETSPERWIGGISPRPVLIVHGDADDVVPVDSARRLYEKAREPKEMVLLPGAGHRLRREEAAVAVLLGWLKRQAQLQGQ